VNVYILTDLEEVAGVASFKDDTRRDARFYLKARALMQTAASRALCKAAAIKPLRPTAPCELTIEYISPEVAEGTRPRGWERLDETTFRNVTDDFLEVAM
jgi:D-aminopeptidase